MYYKINIMISAIVLYARYTDTLSYYDDWLDAFCQSPGFKTEAINLIEKDLNSNNDFLLKLEIAPLIILHHSVTGDTLKYIQSYTSIFKNRKGKLVAFVGNEVNLPNIGMREKINFLKEIQANFIATQLPLDAGVWLYSECVHSKVIAMPHALNPKAFYPDKNFKSRNLDIGTRSARYGVYIGDNDRNEIINFFSTLAKEKNLNVDLGGDAKKPKRFDRKQWKTFLNNSKATIATEAGSFYLEKDDLIVKEILSNLKSKSNKFVLPKEGYQRILYRKLVPNRIREWVKNRLKDKIIESDLLDNDVNFEEIYSKFFKNKMRCPVYSKAISSRHFDAAGTKTLQIMFPGRYNDILQPNEHYVPLERDFSNIEEVLQVLFDEKKHTYIVDNLYDYVLQNHTYENRIKSLLEFVSN